MSSGASFAVAIVCAGIIFAAGCTGTSPHPLPGLQPVPVTIMLPENRSYFMGFTPTPYDISEQAVRDTYRFTAIHSDIILHHFDQGVPWTEAFSNSPYNQAVLNDISFRTGQRVPGQKVYLALTPIAFGRDGLAPYWGDQGNLPLPAGWKGKSFDDPDVIEAYTNYCRYMIDRFHPDYMAYGIEVNILAEKNPAEYRRFVTLAGKVYATLKHENPDLPVFLTFHIDTYVMNKTSQQAAIRMVMPYSDYMAVSTYPYTYREDPANLPSDWFSGMHAIAPEKPFAVAETGFTADNVYLQKYRISLQGNPDRQAKYLTFLLDQANRLDARFVIWFIPGDYDALWSRLQANGGDELIKLWKNCGLIDDNGIPRPSLSVWDAWFRLPGVNT